MKLARRAGSTSCLNPTHNSYNKKICRHDTRPSVQLSSVSFSAADNKLGLPHQLVGWGSTVNSPSWVRSVAPENLDFEHFETSEITSERSASFCIWGTTSETAWGAAPPCPNAEPPLHQINLSITTERRSLRHVSNRQSRHLTVRLVWTFQVVDKMVVTGSSDSTACAFLVNSYQPPIKFSAHKKTIICMKAVDGMCTYYFRPAWVALYRINVKKRTGLKLCVRTTR